MTAIDDLIANVLRNRTSDRDELIKCDADTLVAALQSIAAGTTGGNTLCTPGGRLTPVSGAPERGGVNANSLYYTIYNHPYVPVWNGTLYVMTSLVPSGFQLVNTLANATKNPAATIASTNYDLFVWNDAGTLRLSRGIPWQDANQRDPASGIGNLNGYLANAAAIPNGPAAFFGTYVGTIRTDATNGVRSDQEAIVSGAGGGNGRLFIWNMYNRINVICRNVDTTDTWAYTLAVVRPKNNSGNFEVGNAISYVTGLDAQGGSALMSTNIVAGSSSNGAGAAIGNGHGSMTVINTGGGAWGWGAAAVATLDTQTVTQYNTQVVGASYICPLEYANASGVMTWFGDATGGGNGTVRSCFSARMPM